MRYLDGIMPLPGANLLNLGEVASPNPQNNLFRCYLFRPGPLEKSGEFTERARADVIERSDLLPKLFVAPRQHLCVLKSQFSNDFREKCDFLDVGFDQKNLQIRPDYLQRKAWKSAARTSVGEPTVFQGDGLGRVHTLAKMTIKYLQRVADGGQVYLFIPHQQDLYILLNLKHLFVIHRELKLAECTPDDVSGRRGRDGCWHISKSLFLEIQRLFPTSAAKLRVRYRGPAVPATTSTALCQKIAGTRLS
jgi:hypothetical protein